MRLSLLLFLLISQLLVSQNISGVILDSKSKQPLENVTIYLQKDKSGSVSDVSGKFNFKLNATITKTDTLQFSRIGYHTKKITIAELTIEENTILLSKKLETLDEVIVNSSDKLNDLIRFKKLASLKSGVFAFGSQVVGNSIYVIAGNSSYIEDATKKALLEAGRIPGVTFKDLLQATSRSFSLRAYSDKLQIYDIQNNTWSVSETKFRKRTNHNLNCYGNDLYVLGGKRLSDIGKYDYLDDKIEVLKMSSNDVIIDHSNPHQALNFASITYNDNIIVMGGSIKLHKNGRKVYSDASHIYNITSGKWYELPKMKTAKETQGVVIDSKIYLIGGHNGYKLNTIESYDLKTATWKKEGKLFSKMQNPALASHENIIYIFNDDKLFTYDTITKIIEEYDIRLKLRGPRMHYHQNKLYLLGGYILDHNSSLTASTEVYVIDVNEFNKTAPLNSKRFDL